MFDHYMICENGAQNVAENGLVIGFQILARLPYYRGLGLSMVEDIAITVDGTAVEREAIRFTVRNRTYTLAEMETEATDRWEFGEVATLTVLQAGGLPAGDHKIDRNYSPYICGMMG